MKKVFIPVSDLRPLKGLGKAVRALRPYKRVALLSTVQFSHRLDEVKKILKGHDVLICPSILGCRALIPETNCVLVITTGVFHAVKAGLESGKPVFIIGPHGFRKLDDKVINDFKKKQSIRVSKVLDAKLIGVLVSTKPGQSNKKLAKRIVESLRDKGKEAYLFVAGEISPLQLNDFPVDAWINTACPRIVEDDFDKPMVNWDEIKELI
jgi:2-(3-amino-3-carboxypropyl)histidine synthase